MIRSFATHMTCLAMLLAAGLAVPAPADEAPGDLAELHAQLDELFSHERYSHAIWGVRVETLDGEVVYDRNGETNLLPASNLKVVTSAAAHELLGPDFLYETTLEALGYIDQEGVLHGHLLITGSGDPTLGSWHPDREQNSAQVFERWTEALREAGISEVRGNVIGDGRIFNEDFTSPYWEEVHRSWWYVAGSSGLAMEENAYRVFIRPGEEPGDPAELEFVPDTGYMTIINNTRTVPAGERSNADSTWRESRGNTVLFEGDIALDREVINERGSIYDGERYAAFLFKEALARADLPVHGEAVNIRSLQIIEEIDGWPEDSRRLLDTITSRPMPVILDVINKPSHNFYADMVLRTMGAHFGEEGGFAAGAAVVRDWMEGIGVPDAGSFQMADGSGMARFNMVQPRQLTYILAYMRRQSPEGCAFHGSLVIAGEEGGLRNRLAGEDERGRVRAKTGYIRYARTFSGYVESADGQELVFSMMCNNHVISNTYVNATQDDALRILMRTDLGALLAGE